MTTGNHINARPSEDAARLQSDRVRHAIYGAARFPSVPGVRTRFQAALPLYQTETVRYPLYRTYHMVHRQSHQQCSIARRL